MFWQVFTNLQCDLFFDRRVYKLSVWCIFFYMLESSWFYSVMFFEQESLHEALVPMLQSILDSAGADNSSSLTAIITQSLKSQGECRPISRKRQASLDLDSLKSHGKISPQTFIQGWSLVTLRNSVQLQGWSLVTLRKIGLLWPSETVQLQGWSLVTLRKIGLLWPSETVQLQGWSLVTLRNSGQLQGWSQKQCTAYRVGLLWPSKAMYSWLPELLQQ